MARRDIERLLLALETIAQELKAEGRMAQAHAQERIEQLESLLRNGARLMANPQSTDDEWQSWLERIQETVS